MKKKKDRSAPLPRQFRKEHWLGLLTFAVTEKNICVGDYGNHRIKR